MWKIHLVFKKIFFEIILALLISCIITWILPNLEVEVPDKALKEDLQP